MAGGYGSWQNFSQLPRILYGRSIFRSHSKGLGEVLQSVHIEKFKLQVLSHQMPNVENFRTISNFDVISCAPKMISQNVFNQLTFDITAIFSVEKGRKIFAILISYKQTKTQHFAKILVVTRA